MESHSPHLISKANSKTHESEVQEGPGVETAVCVGVGLIALGGIAVAFSPEAQMAIAGAWVVLVANPWALILIALALLALAAFIYFYNSSSCAPVQSSAHDMEKGSHSRISSDQNTVQNKNLQPPSSRPIFPSTTTSNTHNLHPNKGNNKKPPSTSTSTIASSSSQPKTTYLSKEQQEQAKQTLVIEKAQQRWTDAKYKRGLLDKKASGTKKLTEAEEELIQELVLLLKSKGKWNGDVNVNGQNIEAIKAAADQEIDDAYKNWLALVKEAKNQQK